MCTDTAVEIDLRIASNTLKRKMHSHSLVNFRFLAHRRPQIRSHAHDTHAHVVHKHWIHNMRVDRFMRIMAHCLSAVWLALFLPLWLDGFCVELIHHRIVAHHSSNGQNKTAIILINTSNLCHEWVPIFQIDDGRDREKKTGDRNENK